MKHWCDAKQAKDEEDMDIKEQMKQLMQENKDLKQRMTKMEKIDKPSTKTTNINNGTINNNDNRQVTNNITIVAYGKEDMSQIDEEDILRVLKTGFNSTKQLTETMHFNPKYPHFSNIKRSNFNMKNKLMYHNGSNWVTTTDPHMIDELYNRKRDFIEECVEDYSDGLTKYDMARLQRWLGVDDNDKRITRIKGELRELLFNKKEISETNEQNLFADEPEIEEIDDDSDDNTSHDTFIFVRAKNIMEPKKRPIAPKNGRHRKAVVRKRK